MPLFNPSLEMQAYAVAILRASKSCMFRVGMVITNSDGSIQILPLHIKAWNVVHEYESCYSEGNTMTIDVSMEEAIILTSTVATVSTQSSPLHAMISLMRVDEHYHSNLEDKDPQILKYLVFIPNASDILKELQIAEIITREERLKSSTGEIDESRGPDEIRSARYDLPIELQVEETFAKREQPINGLMADTTLDQAVKTIVTALDYKNVKMMPSDNQRVLKHCAIPPIKTLSTGLTELQNTFGIYQKGLAVFEQYDINQENTLYIYPPYDLDPKSPSLELHLFKLQEHAYEGSASFAALSEDETRLYVLLTEQVGFKSLSEVGVEAIGNYHVSKRTDTLIDVDTSRDGRKHTVRDNNLMTTTAESERTALKGRTVARYTEATDNPFTMTSAMSSVMCAMMVTVWNYAWPWIIKPNTKCVYHYEDVDGIRTLEGIVSGVEYRLVLADSIVGPAATYYGWQAAIRARMVVPVNEEPLDPKKLPQYAKFVEVYNQQSGKSMSYNDKAEQVLLGNNCW